MRDNRDISTRVALPAPITKGGKAITHVRVSVAWYDGRIKGYVAYMTGIEVADGCESYMLYGGISGHLLLEPAARYNAKRLAALHAFIEPRIPLALPAFMADDAPTALRVLAGVPLVTEPTPAAAESVTA